MNDTPKSKLWTYLVVVLFSAIIVSLGAKELQARFAQRGGDTDIKKLVRDLKGDPDEIRASLARKAPEPEKKAKHENVDRKDREELKKILDKIAP
jgi:hypothetical protein